MLKYKKKLAKCYQSALVFVTKRCNLGCPRCYLRRLSKEQCKYMMTREQFIRIIERLNEQNINIKWMLFSGGEPTLWPHLVWGIDLAKKSLGCKVRVITNAIDRNAEDYGNADVVGISHYGGMNRLDIYRLRKQLGRKRVRVQSVVHIPWPKTAQNSLPSECGCAHLTFCGDKVYPCGGTGGDETKEGISVEEPFYSHFIKRNPWMSEACNKCLGNRKNVRLSMPNLTMEIGVWDSAIFYMLDFKIKALWLRKIYRYFKWWK